jgi:hypothetical protein
VIDGDLGEIIEKLVMHYHARRLEEHAGAAAK